MDDCTAAVVGAAISADGWPDLRRGWNDRLRAEAPSSGAQIQYATSEQVLLQALEQARCYGPETPSHNLALVTVGCGSAKREPTLSNATLTLFDSPSFGQALSLALELMAQSRYDAVALQCLSSDRQSAAFVLKRPREAWRAGLPCFGLLRPAPATLPAIGIQLSVSPHPRSLDLQNGPCCLHRPDESDQPIHHGRSFLELLLSVHDRILPPTRRQSEVPPPFTQLKEARPWFGGLDLRPRQALWKDGPVEILLREPTDPPRRYADEWPFEVFLMAAESRLGLQNRIAEVQEALKVTTHLSDLAFGMSQQSKGNHRLAIVAAGRENLEKSLNTAAERLTDPHCLRLGLASGIFYDIAGPDRPRLAVVIPGQGSQYPNMLADLCLAIPSMQAWFDRFDEESIPGGPAPSEFLFPIAGAHRGDDPQQLLMGEEGAEAISVAAIGLHDLWERLGLEPDAIAGYSVGELSALISAGVFLVSRRDLVKLMSELTRERTPGGRSNYPSIAVTNADRAVMETLLEENADDLFLALDSCPSQTVLSGQPQAVSEATRLLRQAGATVLPLRFDRGYHTPLYARKAARIRDLYERIEIGQPRIPIFSCIDLDWFPSDANQVRELAVSQWVKPVRFREAAVALHDQGFSYFLEVGPGSRLTGFLRDSLRGRKHKALSSDAQDRSGLRQFLLSFAQLFVAGFSLQTNPLFDERRLDWPVALGAPPILSTFVPPTPAALPATRTRATNAARAGSNPTSASAGLAPGSGSPHLDVLRGHLALMDDFLTHQARIHDLLRGVQPQPLPPLADSLMPVPSQEEHSDSTAPSIDLLGPPSQRTDDGARWTLSYDVANLPLLLHHTLGGRPSERQGNLCPLPVLPFAFAIELMAQAARQWQPEKEVAELQEVRGLRWLAVDGQSLKLALRAKPENGAIALELFECRDGEEILAYTARAVLARQLSEPPQPLRIELEQKENFQVSGAAFYSFVFHGTAFQGIRGLTAIGKTGAEAEMMVGCPLPLVAHPKQASFLSNPVLQDCAGQLVGFWLLEQHGLVDIGLYPYRLGRLRRFAPEPVPGSTVTCRAKIAFDGRCTEADFDLLYQGQVFARIEGFESRLFRFPPDVFRTLFAIDHTCYLSREVTVGTVKASRIEGLSQDLFDSSWGIWRRALAQVTLSTCERNAWLNVPANQGTTWLLRRLAVKDAVRRWAAAKGVWLLPADIDCGDDGRTLGGVALELLDPLPQIAVDGAGTLAVAVTAEHGQRAGLVLYQDNAEEAAAQAAAQASGSLAQEWKVSYTSSPKDTLRLTRGHNSIDVHLESVGDRGVALCLLPSTYQEGPTHDTQQPRDRDRDSRDRQGDDSRLGSRA